MTEQSVRAVADSQAKIDEIAASLEALGPELERLEAGRAALDAQISQVEGYLAEDNVVTLLAALELESYRLSALTMTAGPCFDTSDMAEAYGTQNMSYLEPTLHLRTPFQRGVEQGYFGSDGTDRIEFTAAEGASTIMDVGEVACNVRRYRPYAPFQQYFIGSDRRDLPDVVRVVLDSRTMPPQYEDEDDPTRDLYAAYLLDIRSFLIVLEFDGVSYRIPASGVPDPEVMVYDDDRLQYYLPFDLALPVSWTTIAPD
jgi:hypothetical protein